MAVAALAALVMLGGALVFISTDEAAADPIYDTVTIRLDQPGLTGSTVTVSVHDRIVVEETYRSWRGGWFNTLYEESYKLGNMPNNGIVNNITDPDYLNEEVGQYTIYFWKQYDDNGLNQHPYWNYSFTLNVIEDTSVSYDSNTDQFVYGWEESVRSGSALIVRSVSNTVTDQDFVGWNTDATGTGTWYQPGDTISSGHTTLYAQWRTAIAVTSASELTLDKGGNIDYSFSINQSGCTISMVDDGPLSLTLSNGRLTGIVDADPGKYTVKFSIDKGVQHSDFFLTVYVKIYQIQPIDEMAYTGEGWARSIELMPSNVTYNLTFGTVTRTVDGVTETISPAEAGLLSPSGTMVSGTFSSAGTYVIHLTATAPNNPELKPTTVEIKVHVEDPVPAISDPTIERTMVSGTSVPDTYDFVAVNPTDYLQIIWNFGDGTSSTGQSVVHHYDYPGNYQWTLTLTAHDGHTDAVYTGYVISLGPSEPSPDAWIGSRYAVMIEAPATATMSAPSFLTSSVITDSITGKTYLLISGTPDDSWSDRTGKTFSVVIKEGTTAINSWTISLHGSSDVSIESSFDISVNGHTVTVTYLGNQNAVVYIAWDGTNYVRLSGTIGQHEYETAASYVLPVIIILGDTQVSDTISFNISEADPLNVQIDRIYNQSVRVGHEISIAVSVQPEGAVIDISGADWLTYADGVISGTPDVAGTYEVSVYATYGSVSSVTQIFTVTVTEGAFSDVSSDDALTYLAIFTIVVLAALTVLARDMRIGGISALVAIGLIWMVIS